MACSRRSIRFLGVWPALSVALLLGITLFTSRASAQPPSGYYDSADQTDASTLRSSLHAIIKDHQRYPYTSSATDTWDILDMADEDPNNSSNVLEIYKNATYAKAGGGNANYNREHSWPKSYGFPDETSTNYPYTDCHHLFIAFDDYNSSRNDKIYENVGTGGTEKPTDVNDGAGGTGQSNWTQTGGWETWIGRRGDVARALFYLDVRYEGGTHGITSAAEPDLILTDNETLIANSATGDNESVAYMGLLSALIEWHEADPVDEREEWRNEVVYSFQGNRNPFIDHPEWVACIFEDDCSGAGGGGGSTDPWINEIHYDNNGTDVGEFVEIAGPAGLSLSGWTLQAYNGSNGAVYDTVSLSGTIPSESNCAGALSFSFAGLQNGAPDGVALVNASSEVVDFISYEGVVMATSGPASGTSSTDVGVSEASTSTVGYSLQLGDSGWQASQDDTPGSINANQTYPSLCAAVDPWVNELHYDNSSTDTNEGVEIAGQAGTDLTGWKVYAYNGSGGATYDSITLSGTIDNESNGYGALWFAFPDLQNGAPDGIALVDDEDNVIQFLSYEGSLNATDGPANGATSTDIGVSETTSTAAGSSLQLSGSGAEYGDFTWSGPSSHSRGSINSGQSF